MTTDKPELQLHIEAILEAKHEASVRAAEPENGRRMIAVTPAGSPDLLLQAEPTGVSAEPIGHVRDAVAMLLTLAARVYEVNGNWRLSQQGKHEALEEIRQKAVHRLADLYAKELGFIHATQDAEAQRYAPPLFSSDKAWKVEIELAHDRELRDRIYRKPERAQAQLARLIEDEKAPDSVVAAILRDPWPESEMLATIAKGTWRKIIDRRDPAGRHALDKDHESHAWAERALFTVAARVQQLARFERHHLAQLVSGSKGFGVFGLQPAEIVSAARYLKHRNVA